LEYLLQLHVRLQMGVVRFMHLSVGGALELLLERPHWTASWYSIYWLYSCWATHSVA